MNAQHVQMRAMQARASFRRRDLRSRVAGLAVIAGAALVFLLFRALLPDVGTYKSLWTLALGLPAFLLASRGILLLTQGAALRDNLRRDCAEATAARVSSREFVDPSIETAPTPDGRLAVASLLAAHAIRAAATSDMRAYTKVRHPLRPPERHRPSPGPTDDA